jgi:electron transport complex protein RnfD
MTTWSKPNYAVDSITSATPLSAYKFDKVLTQIQQMIVGNIGGSIGETSAIAILLGGIFLIVVGIVNWRVPVAMILGMIITSGIFWIIDPTKYPNPLFQIFAGGFLLGTFFMATDWVTSPITKKGMWIFGICISILVFTIRTFGGYPKV